MLARQSRGGGTEPLRQRAAKIDDCLIQNPAYRFTRRKSSLRGAFVSEELGVRRALIHYNVIARALARGNPTKRDRNVGFLLCGIPTVA